LEHVVFWLAKPKVPCYFQIFWQRTANFNVLPFYLLMMVHFLYDNNIDDLAFILGNEIATNGQEKFVLPCNLWICGNYLVPTPFCSYLNRHFSLIICTHSFSFYVLLVRCWFLCCTLLLNIGLFYSWKLRLEWRVVQPRK